MGKPPHVVEFMSLNDTIKAARQAMGKKDVPVYHLAVLGFLIIEPGATPGSIAKEFDLQSDGVAKILKTLQVDYAFVGFEPDADDARIKHFYLTEKGFEVACDYLRGKNLPVPPKGTVPVIHVRRSRVRGGE